MAKSTSHNVFFEIVSLISQLRHDFIVWPSANARDEISRRFQSKSGIPGIIGCIDGSHIAIKSPPHNAVDYYNRNNFHSVMLQAVCNDKKEFIDIYVGSPGRIHDARVFRTSPLYNLLTTNDHSVSENQHLLGDAAYPLLPFLLKPFRDNGHLTVNQTRFNVRMSSARVIIEQTFGLLKGKFRRLKYIDMGRIDMVPVVITAACVLHNFILQQDGDEVPLSDTTECDENFPNHEDDNFQIDLQINLNHVAERKREYITALLR